MYETTLDATLKQVAADLRRPGNVRVVGRGRGQRGADEQRDGAAPEARVDHKRVAQVMRAQGIRRRRVRTTVPLAREVPLPDESEDDVLSLIHISEPTRLMCLSRMPSSA